jgi:hypothetical protein
MSPPTLKHVFNMTLIPGPPVDAGQTPRGKATWIEVTAGEVTGADGRHIAKVLSGSHDPMSRRMSPT